MVLPTAPSLLNSRCSCMHLQWKRTLCILASVVPYLPARYLPAPCKGRCHMDGFDLPFVQHMLSAHPEQRDVVCKGLRTTSLSAGSFSVPSATSPRRWLPCLPAFTNLLGTTCRHSTPRGLLTSVAPCPQRHDDGACPGCKAVHCVCAKPGPASQHTAAMGVAAQLRWPRVSLKAGREPWRALWKIVPL
jgi:hypothetical protein